MTDDSAVVLDSHGLPRMSIVCPRCRRKLLSSEEPVRYCSFCGQKLSDGSPSNQSPLTTEDGVTMAHDSDPEPPVEEDSPTEIGGYRLQRLLGVGGMGRVFEAESIGTGQKVAVKLLSRQLTRHQTSVERFRQEGRLASQLSHPRCVFVVAADTEKGRPYIVMELMPGDTIKDLIDRRGPLPAHEAILLILDVIEGLQEAHRFGVIHRDVKPSNCFLMPDGRVKIGDFGLSKSLGANAQLTQSGAFLGTVLYASPEQVRGEAVEYASDVYSICATLYHMLAGQPPFQHENITAVLAKIISEDAPSIRSVRHDVPRALARVIEKGLERDRSRRWQTLEELRSALAALVPSHLSYGGLTVRVGAYLLDEFIVRLIFVLPLVALLHGLLEINVQHYLPLIFFPVYFVLMEGRSGASLGKRILRLRVCKTGSTDPPGFKQAALRTMAFYLLVTVTLVPARIVFDSGGSGWGALLLSAIPFIAGLLLLIVPMRKSNDFRGMHELISGTCVMKLPRRVRPLALISKRGDRLSMFLPAQQPLPATIGPYAIKGALAAGHDYLLLVGEDALLGRRILIRLRPLTYAHSTRPTQEAHRPTRCRLLQRGQTSIGNTEYNWEAFVAPSGAALADIVATQRRLNWLETRPLLEQLADELTAARSEGNVPALLTLDQVWVQIDGRLQLLEFPVTRPTDAAVLAADPLDLLRNAAALALEGTVRLSGMGYLGPIRAPIPLHARTLIDRLLGGPGGLGDVEGFRDALKQTAELPPQVDHSFRIAQMTLQAFSLLPGLAIMLVMSGLFGVFTVIDRQQSIHSAHRILEGLDDPDTKVRWQADAGLAPFLADESKLRIALLRQLRQDERELERARSSLSGLERSLLALLQPAEPPLASEVDRQVLARAMPDVVHEKPPLADRLEGWRDICLLILFWPIAWACGAFILRGGLSYQILRIAIVDEEGRPASRRRCALRVLLVWLPVALLLCGSVWVQSHRPGLVGLHSLLFALASLLLPIYAALALADPDRSPLDRLLHTRLVPH